MPVSMIHPLPTRYPPCSVCGTPFVWSSENVFMELQRPGGFRWWCTHHGMFVHEPKVLVCGSRGWTNYDAVAGVLNTFPRETVWMHGGDDRGADRLVARYCREQQAREEVYRPCYEDKTVPRRVAPLVRNDFMLELRPSRVLAFWDGESKGTKYVLDGAKRRGIHTETWLS